MSSAVFTKSPGRLTRLLVAATSWRTAVRVTEWVEVDRLAPAAESLTGKQTMPGVNENTFVGRGAHHLCFYRRRTAEEFAV
jgi:hypothetical protein